MSDVAKVQKLAAARKKLKEFKQKQKKEANEKDSDKSESLIGSTHSSLNENVLEPDVCPKELFPPVYDPLNATNNECEQFSTPISSVGHEKIETNNLSHDKHRDEQQNGFQQFNVINFAQVNPNIFDNPNNVMMNSFEPAPQKHMLNDFFDYPKTDQVSENTINEITESVKSYSMNGVENTDQMNNKTVQLSGTESLKQLSSQINNLINENDNFSLNNFVNNDQSNLEKRNQELAAELQRVQIEKDTLKAQLEEKENRTKNLVAEYESGKSEFQMRLNREIGPLKEQLQTHAQTLGILVAEKTELSTSLAQSQLTMKQKIKECEELQGRLRTSRGRVADLEKELNIFRQEKSKLEQLINSEEVAGKNKELEKLRHQVKELNQDLLEIKGKYNVKDEENKQLKSQVQEVSHQLSLTQLRLQQVSAGEKLQNDVQVEALVQEKIQLEKQVKELSESLTATTAERDQSSVQYQHYTEQLNEQVNNLATRLQNLTEENELLSNREQELIRHIGELEKRLQNLQDERVKVVSENALREYSNNSNDNSNHSVEVEELRQEKEVLSAKCQQLMEDKRLLEEEVHFHEEKERDFAEQLEQARENRPDMAKLMASIESDKVAAARAVAQNTDLKVQLEEMQQAFVKSSNDKMDLLEKLTSTKHQNSELSDKCERLGNQLHKLDSALSIKDAELLKERDAVENLSKQLLQYDQLNDRLRHYEAKNASIDVLQNEMLQTKQQLQTLLAENSQLKKRLHVANEIPEEPRSVVENENVDAKRTVDLVLNENQENGNENEVAEEKIQKENLSKDDDKLLEEYRKHIEILQTRNKELELQVYKASKSKILSESGNNNNDLNFGNYENLNKEEAMKFLEEKFLRTMEDVALLTEEKQRLEHLVTQLQGETETIGEYVALYQHQRAILQQKTQEKDQQLKKLQEDRTEVKSKLEHLNLLVKQLVEEKGTTATSELLKQQHHPDDGGHQKLCSEHAYIQEEINKIKEEHKLNTSNDLNENIDPTVNSTAQKIISLLSEIKSSSLVQSPDFSENFHPCSWCSGKLITI